MQMKIYLDSVQIGSFSGLVQSPPDPTFRTKHSCTISRACQVLFTVGRQPVPKCYTDDSA